MFFYIFFFLINLASLGLGVWFAMRHEEILRQRRLVWVDDENAVYVDMTHDSAEVGSLDVVEQATDSAPQTQDWAQTPTIVSEGETFDENEISHLVTSEQYDEVLPVNENMESGELSSIVGEPDTPVDEIVVDEMTPEENDRTPEKRETSLTSIAMIEDVVAMFSSDDSGGLRGDGGELAQQLQEIHDLLVSYDQQNYVVEDAEAFVTPQIAKFASIAFCRPVIRR